jgi:hypothetical protein
VVTIKASTGSRSNFLTVSLVPRIGLPSGVVFPEILGEDLVDEVVGIVLIHFDFFENDAALAGDIVLIENVG